MTTVALNLWRCCKCGRVLLEYVTASATFRKKCDRCDTWNTLQIK